MKRLLLVFMGVFFLFLSSCKKEMEKPNLLFIITDQQRFDAIGKVGKFPFLKTPNIDKLADNGVMYNNAYTQCAVCAPARATILTGRTVENHGIYTNHYIDSIRTPMKTFDEILSENGYYTEYHGKFHSPTAMSEVYEQFTSNEDYAKYLDEKSPFVEPKSGERVDNTYKRAYKMDPMDPLYGKEPNAKLYDGNGNELNIIQPDQHGELQVSSEHSITAFQAKKVIQAIKNAKKVGKPFSITSSLHYPHSPILPTKPYYQMYDFEDMPIPNSIGDKMENSPYYYTNGRVFLPEYADTIKIKYMMSSYFGLVTEIDTWVGKILEELDKNGFADNTLVIFTSDHGEMLGAHGMREKNVFYDESSHVPLIMRFPGKINEGLRVDNPVSNVNLFATILDYLNIDNNESDGFSLRGLNNGDNSVANDFVVTEWNFNNKDNEPNYMIVKGNWKLFIPYSKESKVIDALYNMQKDPNEINNLLGNNPEKEKYLEKANELKEILMRWLKDKKSIHYQGVKERIL